MSGLEHIRKVYLLGIGGIGMSALARFFKGRGAEVMGYDKTPSSLTAQLEAEGINVHYTDSPDLIPKDWFLAEDALFILTPAVPPDLYERRAVEENALRLMKRSEVLGALSSDYTCLAVAGTHGKTTTSTLLAHLLASAGAEPSAFLGGISVNYNSNLLVGKSDLLVVEADEFDRSFHRLHPNGAIITAMDADHLDIYGTAKALEQAFRQFAAQVSGPLLHHVSLPLEGLSYGLDSGDYHTEGLLIHKGAYSYYFCTPGGKFPVVQHYPGRHNVENALAAGALALEFGLRPDQVAEGISSFRGVRRRFEIHLSGKRVFIDDYAHHPREIEAFVHGVRELHPDKEITGIFQPHLFTRTRDFMDGFAESLSLLDRCWLMDIYPARELPLPGITSAALLEKVRAKDKALVTAAELPALVAKEKPEVLLTIGAGDIDRLVEPLKAALK